jgi:hypothetical protein
MAWNLETEPESDEESGWMWSLVDHELSPLGTAEGAAARMA